MSVFMSINLLITKIPNEKEYTVGSLKLTGCAWLTDKQIETRLITWCIVITWTLQSVIFFLSKFIRNYVNFFDEESKLYFVVTSRYYIHIRFRGWQDCSILFHLLYVCVKRETWFFERVFCCFDEKVLILNGIWDDTLYRLYINHLMMEFWLKKTGKRREWRPRHVIVRDLINAISGFFIPKIKMCTPKKIYDEFCGYCKQYVKYEQWQMNKRVVKQNFV